MNSPELAQAGELIPFSALPIGARFRLSLGPRSGRYIGGVYTKTGEESYGLADNEPLWTWFEIAGGLVEAAR